KDSCLNYRHEMKLRLPLGIERVQSFLIGRTDVTDREPRDELVTVTNISNFNQKVSLKKEYSWLSPIDYFADGHACSSSSRRRACSMRQQVLDLSLLGKHCGKFNARSFFADSSEVEKSGSFINFS